VTTHYRRRVKLVADTFGPCGDVNLYTRLRAWGVPGMGSPLAIPVAAQDCGEAVRAASAAQRPLVGTIEGALYKPGNFFPANQQGFTQMHWVKWGATAVGYGNDVLSGTTGETHIYRNTKITLSKPRHVCGGYPQTDTPERSRGVQRQRSDRLTCQGLADAGRLVRLHQPERGRRRSRSSELNVRILVVGSARMRSRKSWQASVSSPWRTSSLRCPRSP
jgi:hypothetical protein